MSSLHCRPKHANTTTAATHVLCCQLGCNFLHRGGTKLRYEGMGLGSPYDPPASTATSPLFDAAGTRATGSSPDGPTGPARMSAAPPLMVPLYAYLCGGGPNATDLTMGPADWRPKHGGCLHLTSCFCDNAVVRVFRGFCYIFVGHFNYPYYLNPHPRALTL